MTNLLLLLFALIVVSPFTPPVVLRCYGNKNSRSVERCEAQEGPNYVSSFDDDTTTTHRDRLLYMENPVSINEFIKEKLHCDDDTDSMHFTYGNLLYQNMESLSASSTSSSVSRDVATKHLAPALHGVKIDASESDCTGYAVVIRDGKKNGLPDKERLFEALGLTGAIMEEREITMDELIVEARDFTQSPYFQYTKNQFDEDDVREEDKKVHQKITDILIEHLTDHFKFDFDWPEDDQPICSAPILCGGRASDGNIVAVAAMRVYT